MIKLKELLSEEFNHPVYGSHKANYLVVRPFDVFIETGRMKPTGVYSTPGPGGSKELYRDKGMKVKAKKGMQISNLPGGIFLIDRDRKKAFKIIHQKGGTGKKSNLKKVAVSDIENYVDYVTWKNWLKK
jgi:hypothetical protein